MSKKSLDQYFTAAQSAPPLLDDEQVDALLADSVRGNWFLSSPPVKALLFILKWGVPAMAIITLILSLVISWPLHVPFVGTKSAPEQRLAPSDGHQQADAVIDNRLPEEIHQRSNGVSEYSERRGGRVSIISRSGIQGHTPGIAPSREDETSEVLIANIPVDDVAFIPITCDVCPPHATQELFLSRRIIPDTLRRDTLAPVVPEYPRFSGLWAGWSLQTNDYSGLNALLRTSNFREFIAQSNHLCLEYEFPAVTGFMGWPFDSTKLLWMPRIRFEGMFQPELSSRNGSLRVQMNSWSVLVTDGVYLHRGTSSRVLFVFGVGWNSSMLTIAKAVTLGDLLATGQSNSVTVSREVMLLRATLRADWAFKLFSNTLVYHVGLEGGYTISEYRSGWSSSPSIPFLYSSGSDIEGPNDPFQGLYLGVNLSFGGSNRP